MTTPVAQLADLRKAFPSGRGEIEVLRGISLEIQPGETVAIVGPSGCGKSTLLNILGTLLKPTSGTVTIRDEVVSGLDDRALATIRSRHLGFLFQDHRLLPQCTAIENVLVPTLVDADRAHRSDAPGRARTLLDRLGLADRMDQFPSELSGGECQRVALARALINEPAMVLLDEPTGALDEASATRLADLLLELNGQDGVALVVVTHAPALAARMSRTLTLSNGVVT